MATTSSTQSRTKGQKEAAAPLQRVFRVDDAAVDLGFPPEVVGAHFLMQPGRDYAIANDFLYALHVGDFDQERFVDPPPWMNPGGGRRLRPRSLKAVAQALATGLDLIERRGVDILEFGNADLQQLGADLEERGLRSGIGIIQTAVLQCAQWCAWRGLREPVRVQHRRITIKLGSLDDKRFKDVIKISAIRTQPSQTVRFLNQQQMSDIGAEMRKGDAAHWLAFRLCGETGARGGEPGAIRQCYMPRIPRGGAHCADQPLSYEVQGKGGKWRRPEISTSLLQDIDAYRAVERRERIAKRLAAGEAPSEALLLKKDGTAVTYASLRRAFKEACKQLGLEAKLHWCRHTFAANYLASEAIAQWKAAQDRGVTIARGELSKLIELRQFPLMNILGHTSLKTTAIYLADVQRALAGKLAELRAA